MKKELYVDDYEKHFDMEKIVIVHKIKCKTKARYF